MLAKIEITGTIEVITGMHIGGSSAFSAIGAVDSPVVRDIRTKLPMIPGSSLKGKMRTLLAREMNTVKSDKPDDDDTKLTDLFGSSKKGNVHQGKILFSDMFMSNADELRKQGIDSITEVKFENTINRITAVANPRQIERAIRGSKFQMNLVYDVHEDAEVVKQDIGILAEGMRLLQYDYIGGSGTRGYGKIRFTDLGAEAVIGEVDDDLMTEISQILGTVEGK